MDLVSPVQVHRAQRGLPLMAVTLTAIPRVNTPLLLLMHWHGFADGSLARLRGLGVPARPVPGTGLQLNLPWQRPGELEAAILDLAWRLGAWQLERVEQRACLTLGAPVREAVECHQAFGEYAPEGSGDPQWVDAPDRMALRRLGERLGFVRWMFRPVSGGLARDHDDETLAEDGGRGGGCPVPPEPMRRPWRRARVVYRLGRGRGLWLPSDPGAAEPPGA